MDTQTPLASLPYAIPGSDTADGTLVDDRAIRTTLRFANATAWIPSSKKVLFLAC